MSKPPSCKPLSAWRSRACSRRPPSLTLNPTAHYVPGSEGLFAATLPPPGVYLRDYNWFYYADQLNNAAGNKINGANAKAFVYAQVPRLIWITDAGSAGRLHRS